ncbi:hypothetical protein ACFL5V_12890 [Fibrobacterota bacterium]
MIMPADIISSSAEVDFRDKAVTPELTSHREKGLTYRLASFNAIMEVSWTTREKFQQLHKFYQEIK